MTESTYKPIENKGKFVAYYRVSTEKQGRSGLGLAAQRKAVRDYLNGGDWEFIGEFTEVESGKKSDRPELERALKLCKRKRATLVIARLDRLARNVHFISGLMEKGVKFRAVEFPDADPFMLHVHAAMAEHERKLISARTKAGLERAKAAA
jgi:DNA invertase Pin-like site-specific DNA recombinase